MIITPPPLRIDVRGALQPHLDTAHRKLDALILNLLPEEQRPAAIEAARRERELVQLRNNPFYALGQIDKAWREGMEAFARAFTAGQEGR